MINCVSFKPLQCPGEILNKDVFSMAQKAISKSKRFFINLTYTTSSADALKSAYLANKDTRLFAVIMEKPEKVIGCKPDIITAPDAVDLKFDVWGVMDINGRIFTTVQACHAGASNP